MRSKPLDIFICLIFIKQNRVTIIHLIHTRINRDRLLHYINLFLSLILLFIATIFTKLTSKVIFSHKQQSVEALYNRSTDFILIPLLL